MTAAVASNIGAVTCRVDLRRHPSVGVPGELLRDALVHAVLSEHGHPAVVPLVGGRTLSLLPGPMHA
jgi:hypothetical protein